MVISPLLHNIYVQTDLFTFYTQHIHTFSSVQGQVHLKITTVLFPKAVSWSNNIATGSLPTPEESLKAPAQSLH